MIYIVIRREYDKVYVKGVFSTLEKAKKYIQELSYFEKEWHYIEEHTIE